MIDVATSQGMLAVTSSLNKQGIDSPYSPLREHRIAEGLILAMGY